MKSRKTSVDIGVKQKRIFTDIAGILTALAGLAVCLLWLLWNGNLYGEYMLVNGKEVSATITGYEFFRETVNIESDSPLTVSGWRNIYSYRDDASGREYSGVCYWWKTEADAKAELGKTIPVVIDVNGTYSSVGTKQQYNVHYDHSRDLALAVSASALFAFFVYILIYRGIYRDRLNAKISEYIGGTSENGFLADSYVVKGEVVGAFGLIWCYIKVAYRDNSGYVVGRWARSWFTRKEMLYLKNKRYINIVPYKNTYGILEQMTVGK